MRKPASVAVCAAAGAAAVAVGAVGFYGCEQLTKRLPRYRAQRQLLAEYEAAMLPPRGEMQALEDDIVKQMEDGMRKTGSSTILMLPTYVLRMPTGEERGSCYALDIGGTNFRVMYCRLSDSHSKVEASVIEQVAIPREVYTGTADQLFGFLARSMRDFISRHNPTDLSARPTVGFCFSFPMEQLALNSARLVNWTKGFDVAGLSKWRPSGASPDAVTAINTEWGCYSSELLPRVQEDRELDAESGNAKGQMLIEKLMSGLWMGDCARRILLTFARRTQLFGAPVPPRLFEAGAFTTAHLSSIEGDSSPLRSTVARVLREALDINTAELGLEALYMVQSVCRLVVRRSARMAAVALLAILRLQGWLESPRRTVVAVDGGVFLKYYGWRVFLDEYIAEGLVHHGQDAKRLAALIQFRPQADGSCLGAAVLAAAAVAGDK
ncbi:hexokinase [Raphidocelis subcapitata]|uniref:Phosphotransferase n=1 Tax=Raphidocelis subcapitata TaxID=307507 RepID=A0A2V0P583_9CHLO|nr:hexokinase [Raphidocelis subcapitata]|eukprot:GBF92337.1 hexokinase [Raphidocelis subcapitata]